MYVHCAGTGLPEIGRVAPARQPFPNPISVLQPRTGPVSLGNAEGSQVGSEIPEIEFAGEVGGFGGDEIAFVR